jgi:probable F420-dependent oxidoreductase
MPTSKRSWALLPLQPAAQLCAFAKQLERSGYEGAWGVQLPGSAFLPLAAAAAATQTLKLGTGVALAFTRTPLETATSALDLDVISGGCTVLGLGPSIRGINEGWHGVEYEQPLDRLQELVVLVRKIIERGHTRELGVHEGEFYTIDLGGFNLLPKPVRPKIPIYLPALFPRAVRMAAELAEGLAGHPVWSLRWIEEKVMPNLESALGRADRARSDLDLNLWAYVAIHEDGELALRDVRAQLAFYASIPQYGRYFAAHGFREAAQNAAAAAAKGDVRGMAGAISDDMVRTFAVAGTPEEVKKKIDSYWEVADALTLVPPVAGLKPDVTAAYQRAIAEAFLG